MAERPRELSDFKGVGHFEAKSLWIVRWENKYTTILPQEVFTQRNFVADFIRLKLTFKKTNKIMLFSHP